MFEPNFRYTNKIVKNLALIADARAIILNAPLVPKWEVSLRRDALLRSAHSSTAIEGNPLSFDEVGALAAGRKIRHITNRDIRKMFDISNRAAVEFLENIDFVNIANAS